jgi:hypothetical protein
MQPLSNFTDRQQHNLARHLAIELCKVRIRQSGRKITSYWPSQITATGDKLAGQPEFIQLANETLYRLELMLELLSVELPNAR